MNGNQGFVIPEGLTGHKQESAAVHDKYEVVAEESPIGNVGGDGFNSPVVQITSAIGLDSHGGNHGCNPNKPFSVLADNGKSRFVIPDLSQVPAHIMAAVSKKAHDLIEKGGNKKDAGKVIAQVLQEHLAATFPDGTVMTELNTWVNDGHDPFQRPVKLPPPAVMYQSSIKKGVAMNNVNHGGSFPSFNPALSPKAAHPSHPSFGVGPGGSRFGPAVPGGVNQTRPAPAAPPQVIIPPPAEVVIFHLPGGQFTSRFHVAKVVQQDTNIDGQVYDISYMVLVRNNAAADNSDRFVPSSPAPGSVLIAELADGSSYYIHSVTLKYSVGKSDHIILLLQPPQKEELPAGWEQNPAEFTDPLGPMGSPQQELSQEEAASMPQ